MCPTWRRLYLQIVDSEVPTYVDHILPNLIPLHFKSHAPHRAPKIKIVGKGQKRIT